MNLGLLNGLPRGKLHSKTPVSCVEWSGKTRSVWLCGSHWCWCLLIAADANYLLRN